MPKKPFDFDTPEDSPGFLLWQVSITWQRQIKKALEPYGVTHPQFVIMALTLWHMKNNETPVQNRIVKLSKLDKMTVSQALKKLVANKLMRRDE